MLKQDIKLTKESKVKFIKKVTPANAGRIGRTGNDSGDSKDLVTDPNSSTQHMADGRRKTGSGCIPVSGD
jgi:hypothetical protein